jgi:hypothetical protein
VLHEYINTIGAVGNNTFRQIQIFKWEKDLVIEYEQENGKGTTPYDFTLSDDKKMAWRFLLWRLESYYILVLRGKGLSGKKGYIVLKWLHQEITN